MYVTYTFDYAPKYFFTKLYESFPCWITVHISFTTEHTNKYINDYDSNYLEKIIFSSLWGFYSKGY